MKLQEKIIVWPANLDSSKSRCEGRKIPKGIALQAPRLEEIREAAARLSLEVEVVPAKSRPRTWWEKAGYVILPRKQAKVAVVRALANEIRKIRSAKTAPEKDRK